MKIYTIRNEKIQVKVSTLGAELISLQKISTVQNGLSENENEWKEYIWCGKADVWKRHSPVLFPLVGKLKGDKYVYEDKTYYMSQHGFARDMEFELKSQESNEIWFILSYNEETLKKFPFAFELECGYRIEENQLHVMWRVSYNCNKDMVECQESESMHFSIGAHPAFVCPFGKDTMVGEDIVFGVKTDASIADQSMNEELEYTLLNKEGLLAAEKYKLSLNDEKALEIKPDLFDNDALIFELEGEKEISIRHDGIDYVKVIFDAPVFGLWSPTAKGVPFLCIEPWYGRCDRVEFNGRLSEREWGNTMKSGEIFERGYTIEVM